ncbi:MAG: D-alanyl-D-alanine carboxypeptidase [Gammaproteobacteria bacterium]|nr:D-alanyl-D-alanine carboxypeptidase [Gammaproteobacteria bacterium]
MKHKLLGLIFSSILILVPALLAAQVVTPAPPPLSARGYLLIDQQSGRVLASKAANERLEPASITKLMTAYAVFRALESGQMELSDQVLVSEKAWRTPGSRMFIEVGTRVSVELLLQGMIVQSGNDASVALAEYVASSEEIFADLMNQLAAELGMTETHYVNSTGLPAEDHYTSAADIAKLAQAIITEYPEYYRWYSQKEFSYNDIKQPNRNSLLWRDPSVDGLKTGYTEAAGYCLASSAVRDGMRLIAVVLGNRSEESRARESQTLLNYGFRFFETRLLYPAGGAVTEARVWKGSRELTELGVKDDFYVTVPKGSYDQLEAAVDVPARLMAPLDPSQQLGQIRVVLDEQALASADLYSLTDVEDGNFWQRSRDTVLLWFE